MSSDVKIWCDGQWPKTPMYSKECRETFQRKDGALWPTYEYAWERAKLAGWKRAGERDQCPACQEMISQQSQ